MSDDKITMRAARVNAGLTQVDIASKMRISPVTVHNWETGKNYPKLAQFEMYCRLCGINTNRVILPEKLN